MAKTRGLLVKSEDFVKAHKLLNKAGVTTWNLISHWKNPVIAGMIAFLAGIAFGVLVS